MLAELFRRNAIAAVAAVSVFFSLSLFLPRALSQEAVASAPVVDTEVKPEKVGQPADSNGSWLAAFARVFQYDYQYQEQPSRVLVQNSSGAAQLVSNPEYNLNQHTFSFDFSQVFDASDFENARKHPVTIQPWKHFISGLALKVQLGEHPRVVQGTLLSNTDFLQNYNIGGEADFDPAKVFQDFSSTSVDGTIHLKDRLEEAIPKITFKRTTPFDFVKYAGQLTPTSTQNGLNTIQFTWDARRILRRRKLISADEKAVKATEKLCIVENVGSRSYINLPPGANATFCQRLAAGLGNKVFQLGCVSGKGAVFGDEVNADALSIENSALPEPNQCNWEIARE